MDYTGFSQCTLGFTPGQIKRIRDVARVFRGIVPVDEVSPLVLAKSDSYKGYDLSRTLVGILVVACLNQMIYALI